MLRLNTDEIKNLQFEVVIQGINYDELQGSLKFMIEDIEYGIPVKILKDSVSVEVPPLEEIVAKGMKDGDIVECKLDIFGNGFYLNPWDGQFELKTPVKVETKQIKINNDPKSKKKRMSATLKEDEKQEIIPKQNIGLDKEEILEMLFQKLIDQGFNVNSNNVVKEEVQPKPVKKVQPIKQVVETKKYKQLTKKELVEQKIKNKFHRVNSLVKNIKTLTEGKKVIRNPKHIAKEITTEMSDVMQKVHDLKQKKVAKKIIIDENDPLVLMESVGMRNPKMQQTMIEKAIELGGDGDKAITTTLKKLLGVNKENPYEHYGGNNDK